MIEAIINTEEEPIITYPKLMVSNNGGVVLMIAKGHGMLLKQNSESSDKIGNISEAWHMKSFRPLNGTLTLKNK